MLAAGGALTLVAAIYFVVDRRHSHADLSDVAVRSEPAPRIVTAGAVTFTEAELEEYKTVAQSCVAAALKRGDWRIVHLLDTRHFHPGSGPVRLIEGVGERETQYKMTELLRLGASGSYAIFLESRLEGMKHPDLNPAAALTADVMKEGDAWAEQTYLNYFAGVPGLTGVPVVCGSEPGR